MDLPGGSAVKNPPTMQEIACNAEDVDLIPGLGRSSGKGNGNPLQYSCLENPMVRRAWRAQSMGSQESDTIYQTKPPPPNSDTERRVNCDSGCPSSVHMYQAARQAHFMPFYLILTRKNSFLLLDTRRNRPRGS